MNEWASCISTLASTDVPAAPEWPAEARRRIRFGVPVAPAPDPRRASRMTHEEIRALLAAIGPMTALQLSLELGCSLATAHKWLRRLREAGSRRDAGSRRRA